MIGSDVISLVYLHVLLQAEEEGEQQRRDGSESVQQNQEESQIEESVRMEGDIVGLASVVLESRDGTTGAKRLAVKVNGVEFVLVSCAELLLM